MSMSKLIDKDKLSAFERWELPAMEQVRRGNAMSGGRARPRIEESDEEVQPLTAEQIEAIQKEAYAEGFAQGHKDGLAAGQRDVQLQAQRVQQIAKGFAAPLAELDEQLESELTETVIAIARQMVRRELATKPDEIVALVRESINLLPSSASNVKVHVHPDDAKILRDSLELNDDDEPEWKIAEDPALTHGGCRISSDRSRIDATVEHRLNTVISKMLGVERKDEQS